MTTPIRLNVNITAETADQLAALAERKGTTKTEAVRDAVAAWSWIVAESAKGKKILVQDRRGRTNEMIML